MRKKLRTIADHYGYEAQSRSGRMVESEAKIEEKRRREY